MRVVFADRYVLVGARHSSWYEGGLADWSSGAAVISQIMDSLKAQTAAHWRPDRTIVFCSMGGSALGNVGSFEWGEVRFQHSSQSSLRALTLITAMLRYTMLRLYTCMVTRSSEAY